MSCLLIAATVSAVVWALIQGLVPLLIDVFVSTSDDDYGFTKTIVPVNLIRYGDELLVSRSQAKRLLTRIERFKTVILDFDGVRSIGQAFADEIFRVFTLKNKNITVVHINANKDVEQMITHAILNK